MSSISKPKPASEISRLSEDTIKGFDINSSTIEISEMTLYRGSRNSGQKTLEHSEMTNMAGVYLTDDRLSAVKYAVKGTGLKMSDEWHSKKPILYTCSIKDMKILDLSKDKTETAVLEGFSEFLHKIDDSGRLDALLFPDHKWSDDERQLLSDDSKFKEFVSKINGKNVASKIYKKLNGTFTEYIRSFGYDGIMDFDKNILIFDPHKVKIIEEKELS
ncbi:MAG: hypothetical protein KGI06_03055 [Candidatus Micrarchaeota archaeon]|nr:hypothetical protein [Candidatus Micrarchaeota archaeon]